MGGIRNILSNKRLRTGEFYLIFKELLNIFINDKILDFKNVFEFNRERTIHLMDFGVLVNFIITLPMEHRKKLNENFVGIEFRNSDLINF